MWLKSKWYDVLINIFISLIKNNYYINFFFLGNSKVILDNVILRKCL